MIKEKIIHIYFYRLCYIFLIFKFILIYLICVICIENWGHFWKKKKSAQKSWKRLFSLDVSISIIPLNKFDDKNASLLMSFKAIRIYIMFVIFVWKILYLLNCSYHWKKIRIICYGIKVENIYYLYL